MNFLDILILLLVAVLVAMAWRSARRKGGCSDCYEECGKNCKEEKEND